MSRCGHVVEVVVPGAPAHEIGRARARVLCGTDARRPLFEQAPRDRRRVDDDDAVQCACLPGAQDRATEPCLRSDLDGAVDDARSDRAGVGCAADEADELRCVAGEHEDRDLFRAQLSGLAHPGVGVERGAHRGESVEGRATGPHRCRGAGCGSATTTGTPARTFAVQVRRHPRPRPMPRHRGRYRPDRHCGPTRSARPEQALTRRSRPRPTRLRHRARSPGASAGGRPVGRTRIRRRRSSTRGILRPDLVTEGDRSWRSV